MKIYVVVRSKAQRIGKLIAPPGMQADKAAAILGATISGLEKYKPGSYVWDDLVRQATKQGFTFDPIHSEVNCPVLWRGRDST